MNEDHSKNSERLAFGMSAASALIMVACISGLPSASCTAMAETYALAISDFGAAAFAAFFGAVIAVIRPRFLLRSSLPLSYFFTAIAFLIFLLSALSSAQNIKLATRQCFFVTDTQFELHQHQRISLIWPLDLLAIYRSITFGNSN